MKKTAFRIFYLMICLFVSSPPTFCSGAALLVLLAGTTTDSTTGEMLDGVIITTDTGGSAISQQGSYELFLVPGEHTVTATFYCYEPYSFVVSTEEGSEIVQRDISLVPLEDCSCNGDVNNDGNVDIKDLFDKYMELNVWIKDCWLPQLF